MLIRFCGSLVLPNNATVPFPIGSTITFAQIGTSQITITAQSGSFYYTPGNKTRNQYSSVSVIKLATDTWIAVGDLTV